MTATTSVVDHRRPIVIEDTEEGDMIATIGLRHEDGHLHPRDGMEEMVGGAGVTTVGRGATREATAGAGLAVAVTAAGLGVGRRRDGMVDMVAEGMIAMGEEGGAVVVMVGAEAVEVDTEDGRLAHREGADVARATAAMIATVIGAGVAEVVEGGRTSCLEIWHVQGSSRMPVEFMWSCKTEKCRKKHQQHDIFSVDSLCTPTSEATSLLLFEGPFPSDSWTQAITQSINHRNPGKSAGSHESTPEGPMTSWPTFCGRRNEFLLFSD